MAQQTGLQFTFEVEGLEASTFVVTAFNGVDNLSLPFSFTIELASRQSTLTANDTIDRPASLTVWMHGEKQQQWRGIVRQFTQGDTGHHHTFYQVELVPPFALLALRQNGCLLIVMIYIFVIEYI